MTADRVYRPAPGSEHARRELMKGAGSQFDERVVSALLSALLSRQSEQVQMERKAA
jgi:HD-GYP domain-containing protein (c-di-GMP phosphodiesterase class II)